MLQTLHDNVLYMGYGQFQSVDAFEQHLQHNHTREFLDFLEEQDITFSFFFMEKMKGIEDIMVRPARLVMKQPYNLVHHAVDHATSSKWCNTVHEAAIA